MTRRCARRTVFCHTRPITSGSWKHKKSQHCSPPRGSQPNWCMRVLQPDANSAQLTRFTVWPRRRRPSPTLLLVTTEHRIDPDDWAEAVAKTEGPQLIVGGPGTGKTEFLVRRALSLLESAGVDPEEILLLSFSRRGVADLKTRVQYAVRPAPTPLCRPRRSTPWLSLVGEPRGTSLQLDHDALASHRSRASGFGP